MVEESEQFILALDIIIGVAFGAVVASLVDDTR